MTTAIAGGIDLFISTPSRLSVQTVDEIVFFGPRPTPQSRTKSKLEDSATVVIPETRIIGFQVFPETAALFQPPTLRKRDEQILRTPALRNHELGESPRVADWIAANVG